MKLKKPDVEDMLYVIIFVLAIMATAFAGVVLVVSMIRLIGIIGG